MKKYTQPFTRPDLPSSSLSSRGWNDATILLTGTTGALGSHLLAQLLAGTDVSRVYALNRSHPTQTLATRQAESFVEQGLDRTLLGLEKLVLLEADVSQRELGLPWSILKSLRQTVTHIILNAWPVNFAYGLPAFESAIKGARNLVDFALSSTAGALPVVQFISSITITLNASPSPALEEPILDSQSVVGLGYAESKWIVERMLQLASAQTGLATQTVRVGQLSGGKTGCWDASSWVPIIVRSAIGLGCLPDSPHDLAWVRVPDAATVLIELLSAHDGPASAVLHLVNPRPIPWRTVFGAYAEALGVPLLPASECLRRLAQSENVPAARLRPFWRMVMQRESEDFTPFEIIDTRKAQALSPALRSMRPLDEADFDSWLAYWMRAGVLERARL